MEGPITRSQAALLAAIDLMTGSGLTTAQIDNAKAVAAIRAGDASGIGHIVRPMIRRKREAHRRWIFVTQRRWQRDTRRTTRARHHDSITIREHYVRCG